MNLAGTVSPAKESRTVYLQQHDSGTWHRVATTRTTAGAFKLPLPTKTAGTFTYRLAVSADAGGASASTRSITFQVVKRPEDGNPAAYRFLTSEATPAGDAGADRERELEFIVTYDRTLVTAAAQSLIGRLRPS